MKHTKLLKHEDQLVGVTVLGERGQVVIPKEARQRLGLKSGDTMLVMAHNDAVVFLPKKKMQAFIKTITRTLDI